MLGSLLSQLLRLCDTVPDEANTLFEKYEKRMSPTVEHLQELLKVAFGYFTRCFIVLDALDECDILERETLLRTLDQLSETGNLQNTRFLFTSRKEHDIDIAFSKARIHPVCIQDEKVAADVELYVSGHMEKDERLKRLPRDLKKDIICALSRGARGMYDCLCSI